MRTARPLLLACLSACGSNPPCTECPDISGSYRLTYQSVPAEKSTCGRFRVEGSEEDLVVEQEGSRVVLQPDGREGTLHRDLTLRFPYRESETTKGIRTATRHLLSGRIELEPSVRFTGEMDMEVRQDSCSLSVPCPGSRRRSDLDWPRSGGASVCTRADIEGDEVGELKYKEFRPFGLGASLMRLAFPLFVVACLSACGSNPPCTECPDIRGRYTMVFDAVPVEKSTCLRYFSEVAEFEVVVQQTNSEIIVQPMEWKATLYEDLSLRFEPWDGETSDGHRTREHLKGRLSLEPGVTFKGTLSGQIPTQSCGISIPVSWR